MSDPIKFIFIVTADHGSFDALANERTLELCKKFYKQRLKTGAVLPAPAILRFVPLALPQQYDQRLRLFSVDDRKSASAYQHCAEVEDVERLRGFG